jgi:hypothetical protein
MWGEPSWPELSRMQAVTMRAKFRQLIDTASVLAAMVFAIRRERITIVAITGSSVIIPECAAHEVKESRCALE